MHKKRIRLRSKIYGCYRALRYSEVDAGPIICQEVVKIEETDTVESLELKIHDTEHKIYPAALKKIFV
jgi:formyltetrahydrofolate-dependent phosphoribosylglycinamide formyltransferase (EC 2.1.2.2)